MRPEIGLYIEAQEGVTWRDWHRLALRAETLGFDAIVSSVHLMSLQSSSKWAIDIWPVMTSIALWTRRIQFGPMVLPITFFHPSQIARMSASLDRLSGGRFRLRLGAGRHQGEHQAFGLSFPEHDERAAMLGEAVQIIRLLWSGEVVSFAGRWYRLEEAQLQPTPGQSWIGVGGNSEPSLSVAALADEWCTAGGSIEELRKPMERLDVLSRSAGRNPKDISRSVMNGVLIGRDTIELERRAIKLVDIMPELAGDVPGAILERAKSDWQWWVGTPQEITEKINKLVEAGFDQIFFQVFDFRDIKALDLLAGEVIPLLRRDQHSSP